MSEVPLYRPISVFSHARAVCREVGYEKNEQCLQVIDSGLVGLTRREDARIWDRPRVVYHRVYFSIRRLTVLVQTRQRQQFLLFWRPTSSSSSSVLLSSLELSDTQEEEVYEPEIPARLETAAHFYHFGGQVVFAPLCSTGVPRS